MSKISIFSISSISSIISIPSTPSSHPLARGSKNTQKNINYIQ